MLDIADYAVKSWFDERADYSYHSKSCAPNKECGHYVTMVNWKVYRIGCGLTQCTGTDSVKTNYETGFAVNPLMMVCEYSHSPIVNFPPYIVGPKCTSCFGCGHFSCAEEHIQDDVNCGVLKKHTNLECSGESCFDGMCISPLRDFKLVKELTGRIIQKSALQRTIEPETKGKFTSTEVLELLDCVNNLRSSVKPPAKNLPQISWSNDLAHKASEVAEASCNGEIDSVEEIIGMGLNANIAFSKIKPRSVCSAVSFWGSGKKIYKFTKNKKGSFCKMKSPKKVSPKITARQQQLKNTCKDYARLISVNGSSIGCSQLQCVNSNSWRFVCVVPHTYSDFKKPYDNGKWCAACSGKLAGLKATIFEGNDQNWRHRRDYSDIENSVGNFLDNLDFFLGKFEIIRNILKDIRYTYFILKQDIILIQEEIQGLSEKVTAIDVTRIMDMCIKFIDDLILYFDVILQGWADLLEPWIIFDKNTIMGYLNYILQLTTLLSASATFIELIARILQAINDPGSSILDILLDFLGDFDSIGGIIDGLLPQIAQNLG
ncbi:Oidioi.mRNA.OKI2018_I69.PAR.g9017.t1.cds [Oikopleura dioica]|uniref:Oidioi.mRNA.OKI2018_I69.PAR.g9017.t1.cds n=1 Tax=Oikopleura dioica TaxID=34765 RepID=A0ABN7RMN9_OIKDI|nr:Oidioi.mRNA.OKI2018_I69.PAR.g9017.t1.cds [Oikopleura dioica]